MDEILKVLTENIGNERNSDFHRLFYSMNASQVDKVIAEVVVEIFRNAKELRTKNKSLQLLFDKDFNFLEPPFRQAYTKSRYLDLKMNALRGLAQFAIEEEICELLIKFNMTLRKRPESTPYNYQEYELLKGKHALPFLVHKYGYKSFRETLAIENAQYDSMPDAFKGHYTTDESGEIVMLRSGEEAGKMMQEFFQNKGNS